MIRRVTLFLAAALMSGAALAGFTVKGEGATPEMACWTYEKNANRMSHGKGECYVSCKIANVQYDAARKLYTYQDNAPNHQGSCKKAKYDRKRVGDTEFARRYPEPGKPVPPPQPKPAPAQVKEPLQGVVAMTYRPSRENYVEVTLRNPTTEKAVTTIEIIARDAGYSQPARAIARETIVLEPRQVLTREYHSWRGTDWNVRQL